MEKVRKYLCPIGATIREVMQRLNVGLNGFIVLEDEEGVVRGVMTDGDIRRVLLEGAGMDDPVAPHMNTGFTYAHEGKQPREYLGQLNNVIKQLPVLSTSGKLVDIIFAQKTAVLPITAPSLAGNELKYVTDCVVTSWISSQGAYVTKFERAFSEFHGGRFALATSNGTTALHLALAAQGIGPGDEVIVPNSTFAATANVVVHTGATPRFVDVLPDCWTIDPEKVRQAISVRTKAIIPVHLYGHPADMDAIRAIAREHDLVIIEDCAESLGARYRNELTGTLGTVGCFSFFSNKVITTGEGGMVVTADEGLYRKMCQLRDHGMSTTRRYWHDYAGFNYRLTNMQAAIGLAQMEQIAAFLEHRRQVVRVYQSRLAGIPGLTLPVQKDGVENIYWLYTLLVDEKIFGLSRDELIAKLRECGVDSRPFFPGLAGQPAYHAFTPVREFPISDRLQRTGLSLPTGNNLPLQEVEYVCACFKKLSSA